MNKILWAIFREDFFHGTDTVKIIQRNIVYRDVMRVEFESVNDELNIKCCGLVGESAIAVEFDNLFTFRGSERFPFAINKKLVERLADWNIRIHS